MPRTEPQRTCLGCREEKGKNELLRYVLDPEGTVVPDILAKLPGRGAYTCFCRDCVEKAAIRKQFARAFKGEVKGATSGELQRRFFIALRSGLLHIWPWQTRQERSSPEAIW